MFSVVKDLLSFRSGGMHPGSVVPMSHTKKLASASNFFPTRSSSSNFIPTRSGSDYCASPLGGGASADPDFGAMDMLMQVQASYSNKVGGQYNQSTDLLLESEV